MVSVPPVSPLSGEQIEARSLSLVRQLHPDTIDRCIALPIHLILETQLTAVCGVHFCVDNLPDGTEGRFEGDELIINNNVYWAAHRGDPRARYTFAHEFGHCVLHKAQLKAMNQSRTNAPRLYCRDELKPYLDPEWQANKFAAALLMPRPAVRALAAGQPLWRPGELESEVAQVLNVSKQTAGYRVADLRKKGGLSV